MLEPSGATSTFVHVMVVVLISTCSGRSGTVYGSGGVNGSRSTSAGSGSGS